jgi:multiple sugar transport system substrate-binding protein
VFNRRYTAVTAALLASGVLVGACGGSDGGGGGGSTSEEGSTSGAKVIDPKLADNAKGEVTYCQGKDTSGNATYMVEQFNKKYKSQGLTAKLVEFPASADLQREQFIQRQQAKSGECDVFSSDVIWTAEFAAQKWLYDMTPYIKDKASEYLKAPLQTVNYDGKYWGVPESSDAGLLYVNTSKVKDVPDTWQGVYESAKSNGGIVYQGAAYEGLTCDFLELLFASGGKVLNDDGTKAEINSPEAKAALDFMVNGVKDGAAPKSVVTYMEPESLAQWQTGGPAYMRNWPYAYAISNSKKDSPKTAGKFEAVPQPSFEGGGKGGILGGHNSVISAYSKNPGAALKLIEFIGSPEIQKAYATQFSLTPVRNDVYDDPAVKKAIPFSDALKQAVEQAGARPVSPVYPQISQAIYKNVNAALSGQKSSDQALKDAQSQIEKALSTF